MKKYSSASKAANKAHHYSASIDQQVKELLQENSSLKMSNSHLNEKLMHKSRQLNEKRRENSTTFERMFELEQELAFYKLDQAFPREAPHSERQSVDYKEEYRNFRSHQDESYSNSHYGKHTSIGSKTNSKNPHIHS